MWQTTSPYVHVCHDRGDDRDVVGDRGGTHVITIRGDIDIASRDEISRVLGRFIRVTEAPRLVIDLRPVGFTDTALLKILCQAEAEVAPRNGGIHIVAVHPLVIRMLRVSGLSRRFPPQPTVGAALTLANAASAPGLS